MQTLTNIQYELFIVLSIVGSLKCDTYIQVIFVFKLEQKKELGTIRHRCSNKDVSGDLLSNCTEHFVIHRPCSEDSFYFFTSWITSSSTNTWSLPTF